MIQWNNVKKVKPRKNKKVLAFTGGGSLCEVRFNGEYFFSNTAKFGKGGILYWAEVNKPKLKKPKKIDFKIKKGPQLIGANFDAFQSPIDGSVIRDPSSLRAHNKKHGVTNIADYSEGHFETKGREMAKKAQGQTEEDKIERKKALDKTLTEMGV